MRRLDVRLVRPGVHRCIGAELARMELEAALPALARRFPDLALAVDPDGLRYRRRPLAFGFGELPVRVAKVTT